MSQETLGKSHATPELSLDEWFGLPDDQPGELVEGRLVEEEVPDYLHELLVALLVSILNNWISPRGGLVAGSEANSRSAPGAAGSPISPSTCRAAAAPRPGA
jgi:Uma2 family endonuclease